MSYSYFLDDTWQIYLWGALGNASLRCFIFGKPLTFQLRNPSAVGADKVKLSNSAISSKHIHLVRDSGGRGMSWADEFLRCIQQADSSLADGDCICFKFWVTGL